MPRLLLATACFGLVAGPARAETDFARDVLPILSDACFHCHGPDEAARQAGLRLDTKDGAFRKKRDRVIIFPGKSGESELVRRILSADPAEAMPPPDSNRKLTAAQRKTLQTWIDEGAKWGTHWAYTPPRDVPPRPTTDVIDGFVRDRLTREKLAPAPAAAPETWLRRVTLDLTGLPPTPAEQDAFLKDSSPAARGKLVDKLLASPRFGERMAADWLDIARYADTHGYQADRDRPMWPYRDWVIRAFNANLPFDQFARWQVAGDMLPAATKDQRLATAFNRLHMQNEEGGIVGEEFRVAYVADRVSTFGTAFLGQTFECCRCHDHKYDPVSQKEYYQLFAFFQNVDEAGQTTYFTNAMPVPTLLLSTADQDTKLAALEAAVRAKEAALAAERVKAKAAFDPAKLIAKPTGPVAKYAFDDLAGGKAANAVNAKLAAVAHDGPGLVPGKVGKAALLNGDNGFTFPGVGHFSRADAFGFGVWVKPPAVHAPRAVVLHHTRAPVDAGSRGYELLLEDGRAAFGLHHMWPGNSLKVATRAAVPAGEWTHLAVSYDGSSRAAGLKLFVNGRAADVTIERDGLWKDITYDGGEPELAAGNRFRDTGFKGGAIDELAIFDRAITATDAALLAAVPAPADDAFEHFFNTTHELAVKLRAELHSARKAQAAFVNPIPEAMVMRELPTPKPAFILKRGAYDSPGDAVTPNTPAALTPLPAGGPRNRLGLANWMTSPQNPLFARVAVNRLWQQMFGTGLVETSDNFGTTGTPPTHPELLDALARDFARDYDVKRVLKAIALSATYSQSSAASPELLAKDPLNQFLARGPARRLTAEMLRDQALAVSGLLAEKTGGPSVYPYQPEGLWNEAMGRPGYPRSRGADLYRRSLYTYWKRTAPPPQMATFDAADRSTCSARRQSTSTPLQALVLLNDTQYVEAAKKLGERMLAEGGTAPGAWAFAAVTGRAATAKEAVILAKLFAEQQAAFAKDLPAANKLLAVGDAKPDAKHPPAAAAAAAVTALAILNHDEAVHRR